MNREQLLKKIDKPWEALNEAYAGLNEAQLTQPGVTGDWSVIDILAHVSAWENEALTHLPHILEGRRPPKYADLYGGIKLAEFPHAGTNPKVPDASADVVLTFRNVHNWRFGGADNTANAFKQIFAMLKPGGTLGVVDHRLNESDDAAKEEKSGYMKESSIIAFAEAAGFKLAGKSEINANLKDTKDYEKGVWTLPPVLREGEVDRAKYVAIGESDRMTLKFVKPAS